jgi:hypothetical protein
LAHSPENPHISACFVLDFCTGRAKIVNWLFEYDPICSPIRWKGCDLSVDGAILSACQMSVPMPDRDPSVWKEHDWKRLLHYTEQRTVIPVIGPQLLEVQINGHSTLLDRYIATELARDYSLSMEEDCSLNEVACAFLQSGERRENLYTAIHDIVSQAKIRPPESLVRLAQITHFNLFVTTTFDTLLEQALKDARNVEPKTIAYCPNDKKDISPDDLRRPTVYHLLGKSEPIPNYYVVTDEDLLEFVHALRKESYQPERLFQELRNKNLLILGENFPDWLTRVFLRTAKQCRLSCQAEGERFSPEVERFVADSRQSLFHFLRNFSKHTVVEPKTSPPEFVNELWQRWDKKFHGSLPEPLGSPNGTNKPMPEGAVFMSYAHEDHEAVHQLYAGLSDAGLNVWYDKRNLGAGDVYNEKIRKNIRRCKCFVAILSRHTHARDDAYFHREWNWALIRREDFRQARRFIVPVIVDDLEQADVPDDFQDFQITRLPGGQATADFVREIKEILSAQPASASQAGSVHGH